MTDMFLKVTGGVIRLIHNLAALLLLISVTLTFFQVITRFVFNNPSTWSETMSRSLMIWAVFLAAAAAFRYGAMISVEVIYRLVPPGRHLWLNGGIMVVVLVFLFILGWYGYEMTMRVRHQEVALIYISMSWFYAALPTGAVFSIIGVIARYVELVRDERRQREHLEGGQEHPEYAV